jgi:hypothetical protein
VTCCNYVHEPFLWIHIFTCALISILDLLLVGCRYEQLATKAFNPNNDNIYRGYFPLVEGQLSHKRGYDVGPTYQNIPEEHHDNPLLMETPTLKLPGREKEVDEFHKVE